MNWTSGRLNRSTKANKDPVRKKQKQYFARQRTDNGKRTRSPLSLAHFQEDAKNAAAARPVTSHHFTSTLHYAPLSQPLQGSEQSDPRLMSTRPRLDHPVEESLEHVRRRLLKSKDWTGLAIVRPAAISFRSATEMNRIGRRRKISNKTAERVPRVPRDRCKDHEAKKVQAMKRSRYLPATSALQEIDCSIRFGSNIHPSQATDNAAPTLDDVSVKMIEQVTKSPRNAKPYPELHLEHDPPEGLPLLPLDQARGLKSFDEVQQRSSSLVRRMSDSSNPFATKSTRANASMNNFVSPTQRYPVSVPQLGPSHTTADVLQRYRNDGTTQNLENSIQQTDDSTQDPVTAHVMSIGCDDYHNVACDRSPQSHVPSPLEPRFTLDHQVLLEQQLEGTPPAHPQISGACPRSVHQNITRMNSNVQVTTQSSSSKHCIGFPQQRSPYASSMREDESPAKKRRTGGITSDAPRACSRLIPSRTSNDPIQGSIMSTSSGGALGLRNSFLQANHKQQDALASSPPQTRSPAGAPRNPGDENEAWLRHVFPREWQRIHHTFNFSSPVARHANMARIDGLHSSRPWRPSHLLIDRDSEQNTHGLISFSTTIPTVVNTVLNPVEMSQAERFAQSEADFLSPSSPLAGIIDDGLEPISMHGNAAHSVRSFPLPCPTQSVRWSPAANFYSAPKPLLPRFPATPTYREPLQPLSQPRLWTGPEAYNEHGSGRTSMPTPPQHHPYTPLWTSRSIEGSRSRASGMSHDATHKDHENREALVYQNYYSGGMSTPSTAQPRATGIHHRDTLLMHQRQSSKYWT